MLRSILILGGGSAGLLAAAGLKIAIPSLAVRLVRSPDIGIIGVGEGSTPGLTRFLHEHLQLTHDLIAGATPTWKLGLRFLWGPRPYFNYPFGPGLGYRVNALPRNIAFYADQAMEYEEPVSSLMTADRVAFARLDGRPDLGTAFAYHVENERFVAFLEKVALALDVQILDDTLLEATRDESGIRDLLFKSGRRELADLYVDASGFNSLLLGKALAEPFIPYNSTLFCDRAVIGGWQRSDEPIHPYTTCETMESGWCWQIEHENRINRGYVYCSAFADDTQAEQEFRRIAPKVESTRIVRFRSGRYENCWVKNVLAIGNASAFVEPLEATALSAIAHQVRRAAELIRQCAGHVTPSLLKLYNQANARLWDDIRQFLSIHYKYNTRMETAFWKHCRAKTDLAGAQRIVDYYQENGPTTAFGGVLIDPLSIFGVEGYLTLLLGQQVPYRLHEPFSAEERRIWEQVRQQNRQQAAGALSIRQVLDAARNGMFPVDRFNAEAR